MGKALRLGRVVKEWMWAVLVAVLIYQAWTLPGKIAQRADAVHKEVKAGVAAIPQQLDDRVLKPVLTKVEALADKLDKRVGKLEKDTKETVTDTVSKANDRVGEVVQIAGNLEKKLDPALAELTGAAKNLNTSSRLIADALPQFTECAYVDDSGEIVGGSPDCLFNRYQGLSKAAEKTMQDVQAMTHDIKNAVPPTLDTVRKIGDNSDKATAKSAEAADETRQVMHNLAEATKPLPKYIRYPLAVVGAAGPAMAGAVSVLAAAGVLFK